MTEKILVTGDREYTDKVHIYATLDKLGPKCIIHGGARGADSLAGQYAREHGICEIEVKANWNYFHKAAGPIRNKWMLDWCYPIDLVVAFHKNITESKGTKNMVEQARKDGTEVLLADEV